MSEFGKWLEKNYPRVDAKRAYIQALEWVYTHQDLHRPVDIAKAIREELEAVK